jgi:hypothetical protein
MSGRIWAVIWLLAGATWIAWQWINFRSEPVDGIYGRETFYIVGRIVIALVFSIPGFCLLLLGTFKFILDSRKRKRGLSPE